MRSGLAPYEVKAKLERSIDSNMKRGLTRAGAIEKVAREQDLDIAKIIAVTKS